MVSIQTQFDKVFLSYDKILKKLNANNITTKGGNEITHKDLRKAILVMQQKHKNCRWKSKKIKSKKFYIITEGYYWLVYVYFNNEKKLIDADIDFFKKRIELYQKVLNVKSKELFTIDMNMLDLASYFKRKNETVKKAIWKMLKINSNYRYIKDNQYVITKEGIEWLCKNCFKQKYLELLEDYKMELTEQYIKAGFPYDNFLKKN